MTKDDFRALKNFDLTEVARDGMPITYELEKIRVLMMVNNDLFVSFVKDEFSLSARPNVYCRIHSIMSGAHDKKGEHPKGNAVDEDFVGLTLREAFMSALMFPWMGIGFYPRDAGVDDKKTGKTKWAVSHPFLHLDFRTPRWTNGRKSVWYREKGKYISEPRKVMWRIMQPDCNIVYIT